MSASAPPSFCCGVTWIIGGVSVVVDFDTSSLSPEPGQQSFPSLAGALPITPEVFPNLYSIGRSPARGFMCRDCSPKLRWKSPAAVIEHRQRAHPHLFLFDYREVRA